MTPRAHLNPAKDVVNGSQAPPKLGPARRVRATLATFFGAMTRQDSRIVCSTFTRRTRVIIGRIVARNCPVAMGYAFRFLITGGLEKSFADVRVKRVIVKGRRAKARLRYPRRLRAVTTFQFITDAKVLKLARERGDWGLTLPSF